MLDPLDILNYGISAADPRRRVIWGTTLFGGAWIWLGALGVIIVESFLPAVLALVLLGTGLLLVFVGFGLRVDFPYSLRLTGLLYVVALCCLLGILTAQQIGITPAFEAGRRSALAGFLLGLIGCVAALVDVAFARPAFG